MTNNRRAEIAGFMRQHKMKQFSRRSKKNNKM